MAASRYVDHLARQSGDVDLFKQAAQLAQTARQHELAGWELAAREAAVRPRDFAAEQRALEAEFAAPPDDEETP